MKKENFWKQIQNKHCSQQQLFILLKEPTINPILHKTAPLPSSTHLSKYKKEDFKVLFFCLKNHWRFKNEYPIFLPNSKQIID